MPIRQVLQLRAQSMKIEREKSSGRLRLFAIFLALLTVGALMGEKGKHQREDLLKKKTELQEKNERLAVEIRSLERQVTLLRADPRMIERVAKRTLGMARSDETVFVFGLPNQSNR